MRSVNMSTSDRLSARARRCQLSDLLPRLDVELFFWGALENEREPGVRDLM